MRFEKNIAILTSILLLLYVFCEKNASVSLGKLQFMRTAVNSNHGNCRFSFLMDDFFAWIEYNENIVSV